MLLGIEPLQAQIDFKRIVSVIGDRGAGKDLLVHHLVVPYLQSGYKFYSNQFSIWNDPLYDMEYDLSGRLVPKMRIDGKYNPDVIHRVVVLSEAGRYLRKYEYFEDLFEFARKLDNRFFFPSVRASHADLMELAVYPIFPFKPVLGIEGGLWGWTVDTGYRSVINGRFVFLPKKEYIGVYDTKDFTENPNILLSAVRQFIDEEQRRRGRDGIQTVGGFAIGTDADFQQTIERRAKQALASLSRKSR